MNKPDGRLYYVSILFLIFFCQAFYPYELICFLIKVNKFQISINEVQHRMIMCIIVYVLLETERGYTASSVEY